MANGSRTHGRLISRSSSTSRVSIDSILSLSLSLFAFCLSLSLRGGHHSAESHLEASPMVWTAEGPVKSRAVPSLAHDFEERRQLLHERIGVLRRQSPGILPIYKVPSFVGSHGFRFAGARGIGGARGGRGSGAHDTRGCRAIVETNRRHFGASCEYSAGNPVIINTA